MNGFLVAGTHSGCGKTTISLGLMALLKKRGWSVAPFKAGPDFIDPAFHEKATGENSYNLDSVLLSHNTFLHLFDQKSQGKDIAVLEGVMGLYDGLGETGEGSAAELSKLLHLPVILAVSCKGASQSVVATVHGFATFDPRVNVAGVILNHVPNEEHYLFLKKLIEERTGVTCVGYLPTRQGIALESRHLGLIQAGEVDTLVGKIDTLVDLLSQTIDVDRLISISYLPERKSAESMDHSDFWKRDLSGLRIGIAMDEAFTFYYKSNLGLLEQNGALLIPFSPLHDATVPSDVDALYIGGGYPEVYADRLSANASMRTSIRSVAEAGMPIFAECGGLMYLTENIRLLSGETYPMAGVFNTTSVMTKRLQRFGYCRVEWHGETVKAHEFHHSEQLLPDDPNFRYDYQVTKMSNGKCWQCGFTRNNVLAAYAHIQFLSSPAFYYKIIDLWTKRNIQF